MDTGDIGDISAFCLSAPLVGHQNQDEEKFVITGCMNISRYLLSESVGMGVSHSSIYCPLSSSSSYKGLHYILIASANPLIFYAKNPFVNTFQQLYHLSIIANLISLPLY